MPAMRIDRKGLLRGASLLLVKVVVIGALLAWLTSRHLLPAGFTTQMRPVLWLAPISMLVGMVISAWQLNLLLTPQRFTLTYLETLGVIFAAALFGMALPGIGHDAAKALYLCRKTPERLPDALAVLTADHALGAAGKAALTLVLLPLIVASHLITLPLLRSYAQPVLQHAARLPWPVLLPALLLLLMVSALLLRKFRARLSRLGRQYLGALLRYRHAPRLLLACLGVSLLGLTLSVGYTLFAMMLLHGHAPLTAASLITTLLLINLCRRAVAFPIQIGGGSLAFLLLKIAPTTTPQALPAAESHADSHTV